MKLWLVALKRDPDTGVEELRRLDYRVCGSHFAQDDFFPTKEKKAGQTIQRLKLKKSAVPVAAGECSETTEVRKCLSQVSNIKSVG